MPLSNFISAPGGKAHPAYESSALWPVAPEWTTGEVLLAASYRTLLLGVSEATVDRADIEGLRSRMPIDEPWEALLGRASGLASPPLGRERRQSEPQLMPFVPQIARYAGVLGRPRGRWDPGNLVLSTIVSGRGPDRSEALVSRFRDSLRVDRTDDIFARFVEAALEAVEPSAASATRVAAARDQAATWRSRRTRGLVPAERFADDLDRLIETKARLTRRQWTVLVEALLRIGIGMHVLWLCRLNGVVWDLAIRSAEEGTPPSIDEVEALCWQGRDSDDPLLELGRDAEAALKNRIQKYVQARIGLNLLLHVLEDAQLGWEDPLGVPRSNDVTPAEALTLFLSHVAANRSTISTTLGAATSTASLRRTANMLADANPRLLGLATGFPKNLLEFARYSLMQLQPGDDELKSYDQAYLLSRKNRATNSPRPVQPGPAALILLVHTCCASLSGMPATLEDFKAHLAEYGLRAPAGELQNGQTARDLEVLGLIVDSPDAGGGRLLVDPF